jgi:RNA polymerase sigma factor (sigma-70 family)
MLEHLIARLRATTARSEAGGLTDAELLQRWTQRHDEAAFELLVLRHGRLVLSVCQRLLNRADDVEDAFQTTFLVLVRKGGGIARRQALAAWLHTVALRAALAARARQRRESVAPVPDDLAAQDSVHAETRELRAALDEEVRRLPEIYRTAFVLCHLEGLTHEEAARELGLSVGTVGSRLTRARQRLRNRLAGRGLAPSTLAVPSLTTLIPAQLARGTVRAALAVAVGGPVDGVVPARVVSLTEGVLRAMLSTKLKTACAVLLSLSVLVVGGRAVGHWALHAQTPRTAEPSIVAPADPRAASTSPSAKPGSSANAGTSPAEAVELLEVRVRIKKAEQRIAQRGAEGARLRFANTKALAESKAVSSSELNLAQMDLQKAEGQVEVKDGELAEAELLLKHARRRLPTPAAAPPARDLEQRVRDLEQRVEQLTRDVERLSAPRNPELGLDKPGWPGGLTPGLPGLAPEVPR